ncbi:cellulase family glycosylhydrolase [Paenibacillus sp. Marseille-P2973]|uniref:glycoside hydrolase family 5 protein n=1 Tax=Paenibacillus sp. Marseille-P2973 TaxID=1871032 RepID=UPI001B38D8E2|nr:cellulase family glycosylhydrolase [Paenibacillus sp. Marseille-P2973]MBQ4898708.1 cellulase family glycosylhydrolase [Paenibacillus sp. Marseille-P2973]
MFEKSDRSRVKGFLRAEGKKVVNEDGEEIVLTGWGLGNWLLCEGYMWLSHNSRFDRPRRIEAVIRELAGNEYAEHFWKRFRDDYVTREDIRLMAEQGYNSVRIPIGWRVLMEDEPGIHWKEDGFELIDRCLDWCEEFGIYAFLDLHGAPGGQTGANIDDSVDDFPRLLTDEDSWNKGIELWKELARRYRDRWIVGGYDLLNEPVRPGIMEGKHEHYLVRKLVAFYEEAIAAIREIDSRHMLSVEGHHWATNTAVFYKPYDPNMVIHFHRYACMPGKEAYDEYLELSESLNQPLWLGETGENDLEWFAAMYPLAVSLGIGYNLWPWKKMERPNSPYTINKPEGWDEFLAYTEGGPRPGYERTKQILDGYLENIKVENCTAHPAVTASAFRLPGCRVRGTDFDELPGKGISFSGNRQEGNLYKYRAATGMGIIPISDDPQTKRFGFDSGWKNLALELTADEFATYSFCSIEQDNTVTLELICREEALVTVLQDGVETFKAKLSPSDEISSVVINELVPAADAKITVKVQSGIIELHSLRFY